jgi:integrase
LRWLDENAHKASIKNDITAICHFTKYWRGLDIAKIKRDEIAQAVGDLKCKDSTRNRYIAVVRAILTRAAKEWGCLEQIPPIRTYKEKKKRIRWLTPLEADNLIRALPAHYAEIARFALATGLRMSNILELEWSQVNLQRRIAWIHGDQAKAGRDIKVPLSDEAVAVIRERLGKDNARVFGYYKRIESRIWKRAVALAGLEDFRFHDLRHTWASWHVQNGTPLPVLQELGGWECIEMVQRYAHLATDHLSQWAGNATSTLGQPAYARKEITDAGTSVKVA